MTQEAVNQVDNENNESTFLSEDAIVVGGEGDDARQCVSAASYNIKLEFLPEVRELAEIITSSVEKDTESENKKTKKTADSGKRKSSITVSKRSDTKNPPKKRKPIKKIIASAAAVLFLAVAVFAVYEYFKMMSIADSINYVPGTLSFDKVNVLVSQSEIDSFASHSDEVKNILLCGSDIDKYGVSRTDSMIILTLDHKHQKIKMTSLMRDMYLKIPGYQKTKLNAAYTYGGCNLLLKTIYSNFGMKIDRYVCVDYTAFATVVDNLGGVEIEIEEMELEQFNKYVSGGKKNKITKAGTYNLNGKQALSYCRIRKVGTDTARTARQRKVLKEIMKKCRSLSPFEAQQILAVVAPNITTNMSRSEMTDLLLEGLGSLNYETMGLRIPMDDAWKDKKVNNIWYVEVDLNKNARYLNQFIYGDDKTAQKLVTRQQKTDNKKADNDRKNYSKKKKK